MVRFTALLAAAHFLPPSAAAPALGFLVPYLERLWLRPLTPEASSDAANDVVANAGKILHTAAANEHDRVLLEVVSFAGDVGGDFEAVGQANTRRLCGAPSSASWAWWCRRACRRRASAGWT